MNANDPLWLWKQQTNADALNYVLAGVGLLCLIIYGVFAFATDPIVVELSKPYQPEAVSQPLPNSEVQSAAAEYQAKLAAERDAREKLWADYCKPKIEVGADRISRYRYAHAGCENGATGPQ